MPEMILLGAGASVRADVPAAYRMTEALTDGLTGPLGHLASFLLGELLALKGRSGRRPIGSDQGVDIEELVEAVRELRRRSRLPLSAFVNSWHPLLTELEDEPTSSTASRRFLADLQNAAFREARSLVEKATQGRGSIMRAATGTHTPGLEREFNAAVRAVVTGSGRGLRLGQLEGILLQGLGRESWVSDANKVTYLDPLFAPLRSQPTLVIASLNYDNAVELAASSTKVECDVGLEHWAATGEFDVSSPGLKLLKLHGSVDWAWDELDGTRRMRDLGGRPMQIIFGGGNKLTARGPFLDLLFAFRAALSRATRLTAIGYSFRDPHVNEYIYRWLLRHKPRSMRIVDPALMETLAKRPASETNVHGPEPFWSLGWRELSDRIEWIHARAEDALPGLF